MCFGIRLDILCFTFSCCQAYCRNYRRLVDSYRNHNVYV